MLKTQLNACLDKVTLPIELVASLERRQKVIQLCREMTV